MVLHVAGVCGGDVLRGRAADASVTLSAETLRAADASVTLSAETLSRLFEALRGGGCCGSSSCQVHVLHVDLEVLLTLSAFHVTASVMV